MHNARKSGEQFDYFFTGVISATVAYLAKEIVPQKLNSVSFDTSLASFILLLVAMFYAFKRLEATSMATGHNGKLLHLLETRGKLMSAFLNVKSGGHVINEETGAVWNEAALKKEIEGIDKRLPESKEHMEKLHKQVLKTYKLRNYSFLFGFVLLTISKVIKPYLG